MINNVFNYIQQIFEFVSKNINREIYLDKMEDFIHDYKFFIKFLKTNYSQESFINVCIFKVNDIFV